MVSHQTYHIIDITWYHITHHDTANTYQHSAKVQVYIYEVYQISYVQRHLSCHITSHIIYTMTLCVYADRTPHIITSLAIRLSVKLFRGNCCLSFLVLSLSFVSSSLVQCIWVTGVILYVVPVASSTTKAWHGIAYSLHLHYDVRTVVSLS